MTLKQGEEINNKFSILSDSIAALNTNLSVLNRDLVETKNKKAKVDLTLKSTSDSLIISEDEVKKLNDLIRKNETLYWSEKRTWAGWMLFSAFMTVLVAIIK